MKNKKKIRTCGNCVHCTKIPFDHVIISRYVCNSKDSIYLYLGPTKPSYRIECEHHEFKKNHVMPVSESTQRVITNTYGEQVDNKLLTFLEEKENE